jgi:hypothetical protein
MGSLGRIVLVICIFTGAVWADVSSYHIGNSLTNDMRPRGVSAIAAQRGYSAMAERHIRGSTSLKYFWENPSDYSAGHTDTPYREALPNMEWDYVTLQPVGAFSHTLSTEADMVLRFIDLTRQNSQNGDTVFYLYTGWAYRDNYSSDWDRTVLDSDSTWAVHSRDYHEHLIERVRENTEAEVYQIPVGDVVYELDKRIGKGYVPGYTSLSQLYRDNVHMTRDVGRYLAGVTAFATLYGEDPTGLTKPVGFYGQEDAFSPELYAALHGTVWDVVNGHEYSGVPEPATIGILMSGSWLILHRRRHRRRSN